MGDKSPRKRETKKKKAVGKTTAKPSIASIATVESIETKTPK